MKWTPRKDLFWFLKEDVSLDLSQPGERRLAIQHTLDRGGEKDVRDLIAAMGWSRFEQTVRDLVKFLHPRVRPFWNTLLVFTADPTFIGPVSLALEEALTREGMQVTRLRRLPTFAEIRVERAPSHTMVQLAQESPYRLAPTKTFPQFPGLRVDDLPDLAANKLLALFGRAALRDFIDIYWLVREGGWTREVLITNARQKDPGFDLYWLGIALAQFRQYAPTDPEMDLLVRPLAFSDLQGFVQDWMKEIAISLHPSSGGARGQRP